MWLFDNAVSLISSSSLRVSLARLVVRILGKVSQRYKKSLAILIQERSTRCSNDEKLRIWQYDTKILAEKNNYPKSIKYATARIVLLGDSGVGKTGLGWRISHGEYKEHESSHGQQFWLVNELRMCK